MFVSKLTASVIECPYTGHDVFRLEHILSEYCFKHLFRCLIRFVVALDKVLF